MGRNKGLTLIEVIVIIIITIFFAITLPSFMSLKTEHSESKHSNEFNTTVKETVFVKEEKDWYE